MTDKPTTEEDDKSFWPDLSIFFRPTEPVIDRSEREHQPDAELVPGWVLIALVVVIAVLFAVMILAQPHLPIISN